MSDPSIASLWQHHLQSTAAEQLQMIINEMLAASAVGTGGAMAHRLAGSISATAAGIASFLGPRAMRIIARLNKFVTNPVQSLWAPRVPYMAVIEHRGRRSGRGYRTPVMAFVHDGVICVVLNYGAESDWVRNVLAAGTGGVTHRGGRFILIDPHILPVDAAHLPPEVKSVGDPSRRVLRAALNTV